jgi:hypothetical protein
VAKSLKLTGSWLKHLPERKVFHSVQRSGHQGRCRRATVMVEAGFAILSRSGIEDGYLEADKLLLEEIYRAMFEVGRHQVVHPDIVKT